MALSLITKAWPIVMQTGRKFVLVAICDAANDDGACFMCVETIAYKCGMGVRTVQGHLIDLEADEFIWREERLGRSSIYSVNVAILEDAPKNPLWVKRQAMKRTPAKSAGVAKTPAESAPIPVSQSPLNQEKKKKKEAAKPGLPKIAFDEGQLLHITDAQLVTWAAAYPAVSVPAEVLKAAAWLDANPSNQKSDYKRFLNGWLSRAQDKAPRVQPAGHAPARPQYAAHRAPANKHAGAAAAIWGNNAQRSAGDFIDV